MSKPTKRYVKRITKPNGNTPVGTVGEILSKDYNGDYLVKLPSGATEFWFTCFTQLMPVGWSPEAVDKRCGTCEHKDLPLTTKPCLGCGNYSKWQPKQKAVQGIVGKRADRLIVDEVTPEKPSYAMSLEELLKIHEETCEAGRQTMKKKNHDYTNGSTGIFDNFKASEVFSIHPVLGILMRTTDKFKRIETFVNKGTLAVEGEGVLDAIEDSINYLILIKGIILEEQKRKAV